MVTFDSDCIKVTPGCRVAALQIWLSYTQIKTLLIWSPLGQDSKGTNEVLMHTSQWEQHCLRCSAVHTHAQMCTATVYIHAHSEQSQHLCTCQASLVSPHLVGVAPSASISSAPPLGFYLQGIGERQEDSTWERKSHGPISPTMGHWRETRQSRKGRKWG